MFCTRCGSEVSPDQLFCYNCGGQIHHAPFKQGRNGSGTGRKQMRNNRHFVRRGNGFSSRMSSNYNYGYTGQYDSYPKNNNVPEFFRHHNEWKPVMRNGNLSINYGTLIMIFMIIGCIYRGAFILPLLWCVPMTKQASDCIRSGGRMNIWFKLCVLLFVSFTAGILLLLDDEY